MTTELSKKDSQELEARGEAAAAGALAGIDRTKLKLPLIKLAQPGSNEVSDGDAEAGTFINSLTGENLGETVELVIVHAFGGRFYSPDDEDQTYVASGDVAPSSWPEKYAGKLFADIPDAHEQWDRRSNDPNDSHQWGSGPLIQTTHNYVGYRPEEPSLPVRVSLKGTSSKTAGKIDSLLIFAGQPWNTVVSFGSARRESRKGKPYFVWTAEQVRQTTAEERERGIELSLLSQEAEHRYTGDDAEKAPAPAKAAGGIDVA